MMTEDYNKAESVQKVEVPTMFNEFSRCLENENAELHSIADRIAQRLHKVRNTNYPQPDDHRGMDRTPVRGNEDLEYELFSALESLGNLSRKLQESLEKLESII